MGVPLCIGHTVFKSLTYSRGNMKADVTLVILVYTGCMFPYNKNRS
jgi:hypothetical protein